MECLLSKDGEGEHRYGIPVLILILMECLLRVLHLGMEYILDCLNPYSNGMLT